MFVSARQIKDIARQTGFDDCGICSPEIGKQVIDSYNKWISLKYNAGMQYMSKNADIRQNPQMLFEGCKSVISVILSYNTQEEPNCKDFSIAKYALGTDYHIFVKEMLGKMIERLKEIEPSFEGRCLVDSAPIFERHFAEKSGLGFIGQNRCLISPKFGSFVFLGEILTNIESDYDEPLSQNCLNCGLCLQNCPTQALTKDGIDANRCLSYLTIEHKGEIPAEIKSRQGKRIFGCDACQDCCPHNSSVPLKTGIIIPEVQNFSLDEIRGMSGKQYQKKFAKSALSRGRLYLAKKS
ncbi:MAG: tRNA epoxyqueuosine(34) reductase QueG [Bacteroidales bacterium]|nr:tRNA epoxyqueuosine(34) reductase QueG [Bacteroidales bacterium]